MDIVLERMLSVIPRKPDGRFVHGALKEFANNIGLKSGNLVSDWMNGRSSSYLNYVYTVAAVYGVSADWLYGKTDKKEKPTETNLGERLPGFDDLSEENKLRAREYVEMLLKIQQT